MFTLNDFSIKDSMRNKPTIKWVFENFKNDKVNLSNLFYPIDVVKKNPYLENSLYNDFNHLISHQLINFNYEVYLNIWRIPSNI